MTTHELAKKILQMPNIPIATHEHDHDSPHALIWQRVGLRKVANWSGKTIVISADENK